MFDVSGLKVKIFADGANLDGMKEMYGNSLIKGFTTNPTLMRVAGVRDYAAFARDVLQMIPDLPVSFEVFADDLPEMEAQAHEIGSWGDNVFVKIPVTNTRGEFTGPIISNLSKQGIKLNITAVFTLEQVRGIVEALAPETPAIVSVFAGRIADSGIDPIPLMREAAALLRESVPEAELLWASPREILNVLQADDVGCGVITVTNDLLKKLALFGKDQDEYSLETVKMFYNDARAAEYTIEIGAAPNVARTPGVS